MTRTIYILAIAALGLGSSCALQDGEPWGWVDGSATASGAIVEAGGSPSPNVTIDSASANWSVRLVETTTSSSGDGSAFDPQSPPDGYGLCHNGHCHSDEGELVPYDSIRRELASSGGSVERTVARLEGRAALSESATFERTAVVDSTIVDTVEVELSMDLAGTVTIDEDSYQLEILTGPFLMTTPADVSFGPDAPAERSFEIGATFDSSEFFGELDWADVEKSGDTIKFTQTINQTQRDALIDALQEGSLSFQMGD